MKRLDALWPAISAAHAAIAVSAVTADSRSVRTGMLFFALKGLQRDARDFIPQVIASGAAAIFAERDEAWPADTVINGVPVIAIEGLAQQVGPITSRFFGEPSSAMDVLAVTGTNGKTSVANLLAEALTHLGRRSAVLGTLGNGMSGALSRSTHTTLDACHLQAMLAQFHSDGAQCVAMEASSHGLVQGRLNGTQIDVALFTNLTRDHLDYHGDMQRYAAAKAVLFKWPGLRAAVLNADDAASDDYRAILSPAVRLLDYSQQPASNAAIRALDIKLTLSGIRLGVTTPLGDCVIRTALLGRFNISNLLAVIGGLMALDIPLADIAEALSKASPVPGRMQSFVGEHPTVVVDYAHTPDALEKVLGSLREHAEARLVCVFGCGGDRDKGKRPLMGAIAERLADAVFVTSDNPRSESAEQIAEDILAGMTASAVVEMDRHRAIRAAIAGAGRRDIVLVAGKGHEDYQEINGVRHHFDDAEEVRAALAVWRAA